MQEVARPTRLLAQGQARLDAASHGLPRRPETYSKSPGARPIAAKRFAAGDGSADHHVAIDFVARARSPPASAVPVRRASAVKPR